MWNEDIVFEHRRSYKIHAYHVLSLILRRSFISRLCPLVCQLSVQCVCRWSLDHNLINFYVKVRCCFGFVPAPRGRQRDLYGQWVLHEASLYTHFAPVHCIPCIPASNVTETWNVSNTVCYVFFRHSPRVIHRALISGPVQSVDTLCELDICPQTSG